MRMQENPVVKRVLYGLAVAAFSVAIALGLIATFADRITDPNDPIQVHNTGTGGGGTPSGGGSGNPAGAGIVEIVRCAAMRPDLPLGGTYITATGIIQDIPTDWMPIGRIAHCPTGQDLWLSRAPVDGHAHPVANPLTWSVPQDISAGDFSTLPTKVPIPGDSYIIWDETGDHLAADVVRDYRYNQQILHIDLPTTTIGVLLDLTAIGDTLYVLDGNATELRAFSLSTGARMPTTADIDLTTANANPVGLWTDGTTIWVADFDDRRLYAYTAATGAYVSTSDVVLGMGVSNPSQIWNDGTYWYIVEGSEGATGPRVVAYTQGGNESSVRNWSQTQLEETGADPGFWCDRVTCYFARNVATYQILAYNSFTRQRQPALDMAVPSDSGELIALWGNENILVAGFEATITPQVRNNAVRVYWRASPNVGTTAGPPRHFSTPTPIAPGVSLSTRVPNRVANAVGTPGTGTEGSRADHTHQEGPLRTDLAGHTDDRRFELSLGLPSNLQSDGLVAIFARSTGVPAAGEQAYANLNAVVAGTRIVVFSETDLDGQTQSCADAGDVTILATRNADGSSSTTNRVTFTDDGTDFTRATTAQGHPFCWGPRPVALGTAPSGFGDFNAHSQEPTDVAISLDDAAIPQSVLRRARLWVAGRDYTTGDMVFRTVGSTTQIWQAIVPTSSTTFMESQWLLMSGLSVAGTRTNDNDYIQVQADGSYRFANPLAPLEGHANDRRYALAVTLPSSFLSPRGYIMIRRSTTNFAAPSLGDNQNTYYDNLNQVTAGQHLVVFYAPDLDGNTYTQAQAAAVTLIANREFDGSSSPTNRITLSGTSAFSTATNQGITYYYGVRTIALGTAPSGDGDFNVHSVTPSTAPVQIPARDVYPRPLSGDVDVLWTAGTTLAIRLTANGATTYNLFTGRSFGNYNHICMGIDDSANLELGVVCIPTPIFAQLGGGNGDWVSWANDAFIAVRYESNTSFSKRAGDMGLRILWGLR